MGKVVRKYKNLIIFTVIFLLTLVIFKDFISMHYATDTYNIINMGYKDYAIKNSLNDGRVVMCLISLLSDLINLPIQVYVIFLIIIAILISCISIIKLKNILLRYDNHRSKKSEIILLIMSYVTIFNFAFLENMQFVECAVMATSILLYIIAAEILVEKRHNYLIKSLILVVISIFFYQGTVNWFITITFVLSLLKEQKINKNVIKNTLISAIYIIIGIGLNLVQIKITGHIHGMKQVRMGSFKYIFTNIKVISKYFLKILEETFGLFPKYFMIIYLILLYIGSFKLVNNIKRNLELLLIFLVAIGATLAPYLLTLAAFNAGRMCFSIGALIGLFLIYIYCNRKEEKNIEILIGFIATIYIIISVSNYMFIMKEHKIVNMQDKQTCEQIGKWIEEYELDSGETVENIAFIINKYTKVYYKNLKNSSALCCKSTVADWSRIGVINYYTNRKFNEININDTIEGYIYTEYFKDKRWNDLQKSQLIFDGNTLYYCLY